MKIVTLEALKKFKEKLKNIIGDSLPINSIVEIPDNMVVPDGWEEVDDNEIIQITKEEFFESLVDGIEIVEFYAYKFKNMINIQRMVINGLKYNIDVQQDIGIINAKYFPYSNKPVRLLGSYDGGSYINTIVYFDIPNRNFYCIINPGMATYDSKLYIFNEIYFIQ